jgi:opacity protein-like surface antigen
MRKQVLVLLLLVLLLTPCALFAQKNELAVTAGGYFPAGAQTNLGIAGVVEGSFAHRIFSVPTVGIYAEFPLAHTFDTGIRAIDGNYTATFFTPSLKLKLAPGFFMSPYFVAGVGIAHFSAKTGSGATDSNTSAAYDIGGGLDIKFFPFLSLRGEVRDFNSGGVGFIVPGVGGRQNNVLATGGIVLRF